MDILIYGGPLSNRMQSSPRRRGPAPRQQRSEQGGAPFAGLLGDSPELRVLRELVVDPDHAYTKLELASAARVSRTTLDQVLQRFEELGAVVEERRIGRVRLIRVNSENKVVAAFVGMLLATSEVLTPKSKATRGRA